MRFHHVNVFSGRPYSGNSLAVFPEAASVPTQMARTTTELRHPESALVTGPASVDARPAAAEAAVWFSSSPDDRDSTFPPRWCRPARATSCCPWRSGC